MKVLIDTNLLTRLAVTSDPQHAIAFQAILKLDQADCEICLIPQVLTSIGSSPLAPWKSTAWECRPPQSEIPSAI